jgi:hypothetical protein
VLVHAHVLDSCRMKGQYLVCGQCVACPQSVDMLSPERAGAQLSQQSQSCIVSSLGKRKSEIDTNEAACMPMWMLNADGTASPEQHMICLPTVGWVFAFTQQSQSLCVERRNHAC